MNITRYYISKEESFCIKEKKWIFDSQSKITTVKLGRWLFYPKNPGTFSISGDAREIVKDGIRCLVFDSDDSSPYSNLLFPLSNIYYFISNKSKW